ncbi:MAG: class I tRNA ligase family protein, partial [Desulfuromonadales bacterium]|nr:class I tRNA ligase family protein [Desulfuromonadales bacterium]
GWHIECSAMGMELLGESFDIHGGGKDLVFPHHENEIAQSEGATGKPFVRYWLHNGFVNVNHEKMSKSLGNFFTIREILEKYDPEVVRFFILTAHYRSPIDFSDQNLEEAKTGLTRFYEALKAAGDALEQHPPPESVSGSPLQGGEREVFDLVETIEERFGAAMDDDFNTALAIAHLFEVVRGVNRLIGDGRLAQEPRLLAVLQEADSKLRRLGGVLGLLTVEPAAWLARQQAGSLAASGLTPERIEALLAERQQARKDRDFARSDAIRDELTAQGVLLFDSKEGTTWKMK